VLQTDAEIVDGNAVRDGLERWGVTLADRAQPGSFSGTEILFVPGVNHAGLVQALARRGRSCQIRRNRFDRWLNDISRAVALVKTRSIARNNQSRGRLFILTTTRRGLY
jgi:hypothetical protein